MSIVELRVATELLHDFDAFRPELGGREVARRTYPHQPDVTILDMDMDEAPEGAATMDIVLHKVTGEGARIQTVTYYGPDGLELAVSERYSNGGIFPAAWAWATNSSGGPEVVRLAP